MDRRFVHAWDVIAARRDAGEPFDRILRGMRPVELVEVLAGAGERDPLAANAIATELLNRLHRARYMGALLAALFLALSLVVVDGLVTGVWIGFGDNPVEEAVFLIATLVVIASLAGLVRSWMRLTRTRRGRKTTPVSRRP